MGLANTNDYARLRGTDWHELTLYTTAEPCCMCQEYTYTLEQSEAAETHDEPDSPGETDSRGSITTDPTRE